MLVESSDRTRRLDTDSHLQSMQKLKHLEQKAVEDWLVKQQREISSTLQRQEGELRQAESEAREAYDQWEERQGAQVCNGCGVTAVS